MPISSSAIPVNDIQGYLWTVDDQQELACLVARVYLGHAKHVEKILRTLQPHAAKLPTSDNAAASAKDLLHGNEDHRNGLLFQTISWIVAQKDAKSGSLIRLPHLIRAHKGFDGLQIDVAGQDTLSALVIFEDKASKNSRDTVRDEVWPSFRELEAGARENELMQETTALLERATNVDHDKTIQGIVWEQIRRYRVSITGEPAHGDTARFQALFKDYETVAPGNTEKRMAAVLCLTDLRAWMDGFAAEVEKAIDKETA